MSNETYTEPNYPAEAKAELAQADRIIGDFITAVPKHDDGRDMDRVQQRNPAFAARAKVLFSIAERHALNALKRNEFLEAIEILEMWNRQTMAGSDRAVYDNMDARNKALVDALISKAGVMAATIHACRPA